MGADGAEAGNRESGPMKTRRNRSFAQYEFSPSFAGRDRVRYLTDQEGEELRMAAVSARSGARPIRPPTSRLEEAISRAETEFQRMVLMEWGRRNPTPARIYAGYLGWLDVVPTLCVCSECETPSVIIPDPEIVPARGFVLCPNCSLAAARATETVKGD